MAGTLDSLFGGLRSYQTGYVAGGVAAGSGEDSRFVDVTVNSVNVLKTACSFDGGFVGTTNIQAAMEKSGPSQTKLCTIRMINPTTVRISTLDSGGDSRLVGRWQIAESN
jgi:hypothetical protein